MTNSTLRLLPCLDQIPILSILVANDADPVQTQQNAASELGQHCLLAGFSMDSPIKVKTSTRAPKSKNGLIQIIIRLDKSTGDKRVTIKILSIHL